MINNRNESWKRLITEGQVEWWLFSAFRGCELRRGVCIEGILVDSEFYGI